MHTFARALIVASVVTGAGRTGSAQSPGTGDGACAAAAPRRPGVMLTDRITWSPLDRGDVSQVWEVSEDGGATWRTVFNGRYLKKPAAPR